MLYLNEEDVCMLKPPWRLATKIIEEALKVWITGDYAQPIKPYLRYKNPVNRHIAMPAFLGGNFHISGLKWVASFPENIEKKLPRAHSLTILNDPNTGKPSAIINSSLISGIRTAAVSGLLIESFAKAFSDRSFKVGILGFGPIGRLHAEMLNEILGERLDGLYVYDLRASSLKDVSFPKLKVVNSWQAAYEDADLLITATTTSESYIDQFPKHGSLHLNVSLRDYQPRILVGCPHLIVDDWDEVCRENTDIEKAHKEFGLQKEATHPLWDIVINNYFKQLDLTRFLKEEFALFNPMGMGLFDLALAKYYYDRALEKNEGLKLND